MARKRQDDWAFACVVRAAVWGDKPEFEALRPGRPGQRRRPPAGAVEFDDSEAEAALRAFGMEGMLN